MNSKNNKIKDYILIGILSAVNVVIMMVVGIFALILGPIYLVSLHAAVGGLVSGTLILLLAKKTDVKWLFTIVYTITLLIFQLMGMGYLPWQLTTMVTAILADLISNRYRYNNIKLLAISHGVSIAGQALGKILPVFLFADKFKNNFLAKGIDPIYMNKMINFVKGPMSIVVIIFGFCFGVVGIYLGQFIFKKHFERAGLA